jgi:ABC-type dipeptide/oligopeptide/nickel transport system permease component
LDLWRKKTVYFFLLLVFIILTCLATGRFYLNKFDDSKFSAENVYRHIQELSSSKYQGRLAGSSGNTLALHYVESYFKQIGIEPAGEHNTYFQDFQSMVPVYNTEPFFRVIDQQGKTVEDYAFGSDFIEVLSGYGSGGDAASDLFIPSKNITSYSREELSDKVVVVPAMQDNETEYAIDNGVRGIITASLFPKRTPTPLEEKKGKSVLMLSLAGEKFDELAAKHEQKLKAQIHMDIPYKRVDTPNVLGKITGKNPNEFMIIATQIDYLGSANQGIYFPGALDGASGVALMLELAKTMKTQTTVPNKTIIFVAWNNQEFGLKGSKYYAEHPIYPLEKSSVILLKAVGGNKSRELMFGSAGEVGNTFADRVMQYSTDTQVKSLPSRGLTADNEVFVDKNVPAVVVMSALRDKYTGTSYDFRSVRDTIDYIDKENLQAVGISLLNYVRVELFSDYYPRYLTGLDVFVILVYLAGMLVIYLLARLYKLNPKLKVLSTRLEDIYYSIPFNLLTKAYYYLTPVLIIFLALIFISNIPMDFNLVVSGKHSLSNFSWYLVLKQSYLYMRDLFSVGLGTSKYHTNVLDALADSFLKSAVLLLAALIVSFVFGVCKGIRDGYRAKGAKSWGTAGTIVALSIPDVLIVILVQVCLILLNRSNLLPWLVNSEFFSKVFIPFLCLSILPGVYISRIASTVVQEEIQKDYIQVAKAKGLAGWQVVLNHLLIATVIKVIDTLSSVLTVMISNMIIVEYLCYYPGIVYGLMRYYQQNDTVPFIGFAMSLGLIYLAFSMLFKGIAKLINPMKREGVY